MNFNFDLFNEDFQYIIPKYDDFGDGTLIYTFSSVDFYVPKSLSTVLKKFYFFQSLDRAAINKKLRDFGIKENGPIFIKSNVFVKAKVRKPKTKSDGAYGYVNLKAIKFLKEEGGRVIIELADGSDLEILDRLETISKNIFLAKSMKDSFVTADSVGKVV